MQYPIATHGEPGKQNLGKLKELDRTNWNRGKAVVEDKESVNNKVELPSKDRGSQNNQKNESK